MKKLLLALSLAIPNLLFPVAGPGFDQYFTEGCLRLDYFHTGTDKDEFYSCDEIWKEPVWPGSRSNLIDTLNQGKHLFQVYDDKTGELIFSRGFCSIFGEWRTTDQARKGIRRSFSESVRFPYPKGPVRITISTRDKANIYREAWMFLIDPAHPNIRKEANYIGIRTSPLLDNGDPSRKVDIVILPDGYTDKQMRKFKRDASRLVAALFNDEPFKSRKNDFNVRIVEMPSGESGIDNPNAGIYRDNAFSCSFNSFESDRYVLTWDNQTVRKAAALVPYDQIILLANETKYGGGGIYNLYATCASDNRWSEYIFIHEFGHVFAGLGDEYYTSDVSYSEFYTRDVEPWEPNVTVCRDKSKLKWRDLVEQNTLVPTPWEKGAFDAHQMEYNKNRSALLTNGTSQTVIDDFISVNDQWIENFLGHQTNAGNVGTFEGCGYVSEGMYRPFINCRMFSRSKVPFCPVCRRAIEHMIDFNVK